MATYNFKDGHIGQLIIPGGDYMINVNATREIAEGSKQLQQEFKMKGKDENEEERIDKQAGAKGKIIRLEKILEMADKSSTYCDDNQDDEAYGLLEKQYELGAAASFVPALMNFYETLLKIDRGNKSKRTFDELVRIMKESIKPSFKECKKLGDKHREEKNYFRAILFYLIGGRFLPDITDADRVLSGIQGCALGIKLCIMAITEESPAYNEALRLYVIPIMDEMLRIIPDVKGKSGKALTMIEALCMHHLEICQGLVGNYDGSEETLKKSIDILKATFGDDVKTVHLYGTALNNLGATYLRQNKPYEAKDAIAMSIDANMNAEDYNTEEERRADVQRSESAMTQAEEMIRAAEQQ